MVWKKVKKVAGDAANEVSKITMDGVETIKKGKAKATVGIATISIVDIENKFTQFYSDLANQFLGSQATIYDKALDAKYLQTNVGGKYHRLFDEGHDLFDAWDRVKNASQDDTFKQEVINYTSALTKDLVTKMGIPVKSMEQQTFDAIINNLSAIPGLNRAFLYDLFTYNAAELTVSSVSAVGLFLAFKKNDFEKFSEVLGALGISTVISANPILGLITIIASGFAYKKVQLKKEKFAVGASNSLLALGIFAALGLPIFLEIVIVMLVCNGAKRNLFENPELRNYHTDKVKNIDFKNLKSFNFESEFDVGASKTRSKSKSA